MNVFDTLSVRHINRRIDQIAKFCHSEQAEDELTQGTVHPVRALVLRAVLATPGLPDFLYRQRIVRPYEQSGYHVIGAGANATTLRDGDHGVRKIYEQTAHLSEAEQLQLIADFEMRQSITHHHLGSHSVAQAFSVDHHPLRPTRSVVVATQPFVPYGDTLNFYDPATLNRPELIRFRQRCYDMAENSTPRALPDLAGNSNVLIHAETHKPVLIDPIALLHDDPADDKAFLKTSLILKQSDQ